jgi:hypothetical protein
MDACFHKRKPCEIHKVWTSLVDSTRSQGRVKRHYVDDLCDLLDLDNEHEAK